MVYNWLVILAVSWLAMFVGTHAKTTVVVDCGGQFGGFVTGTSCSTADAACKSIGHWSYRAIQGAGALRLGDSHGNPPSTFSSFVSCAFPSFFGSTITQASLKLTVSQIIGANPLNSSWTASGPATVNLAMSYRYGSELDIVPDDMQAAASVSNAGTCSYAGVDSPTLTCTLSSPAIAVLKANTYLQFRLSLNVGTNGDATPDMVQFWAGNSVNGPALTVVSGETGDSVESQPYFMLSGKPNQISGATIGKETVFVGEDMSKGAIGGIAVGAVGAIGILATAAVLGLKLYKSTPRGGPAPYAVRAPSKGSIQIDVKTANNPGGTRIVSPKPLKQSSTIGDSGNSKVVPLKAVLDAGPGLNSQQLTAPAQHSSSLQTDSDSEVVNAGNSALPYSPSAKNVVKVSKLAMDALPPGKGLAAAASSPKPPASGEAAAGDLKPKKKHRSSSRSKSRRSSADSPTAGVTAMKGSASP